MENCVFCKIVKGELKSHKIFEDEKVIAILDSMPAVEGQTVIILKDHRPSYVFLLGNEELERVIITAKDVAKILEERLNVKRVQLIFAGATVDHFHAKLYPTEQKITIEGQKATNEELATIRKKLTEDKI